MGGKSKILMTKGAYVHMDNFDMLLFTDLDGTLLTHDKRISDENMSAISRLRARGGDVTVATGRSVESARRYVNAAGINLPVIVYNGVMIYDYKSEKILWNDMLTEKAVSYVKIIKDRFPNVGIEILRNDKIYVIASNRHVKEHIEIEMLEHTSCELSKTPKDWFKVLMALDEDDIPALAEFINGQGFEDVYCVRSSKNYFEMLPKGSSKGNAMKILCSLLGKDIKNTAAIGDYNNDCEMIEYASVGAAMESAPDIVKSVSDVVCPDCEQNGFAYFVDSIIK